MTAALHGKAAPVHTPAPAGQIPTAATTVTAVHASPADDPDLMLFGADPSIQLASARVSTPRHSAVPQAAGQPGPSQPTTSPTRPGIPMQQQTFAEVGRDFDPDLDPAGRMVVFASTRHNAKPNLYLQSARGRAVTQLSDDPGSEIQPRFAPDGKRVAFASDRSGQWDIYILDLEHRTTTQVTHNEDHELTPAFSPDGKWLAYSRLSSASGLWELWLASLAEKEERCIGQGLMPRFSPDGSHIAFQKPRERDGRLFSIWTIKLTNGEPSWPAEIAAEPDAALICPAWSPDGARIAYCRVPAAGPTGQANSAAGRPTQADLFIVDADGSQRIRLTDGGASFGPCWSSEGRVFFSANRDGRERIWSLRTGWPAKQDLASTAMKGPN